MLRLFLCAAALPSIALSIDPGPTYGKDYVGSDYNVTDWHSPQSMSPNHWAAAAAECAALCAADPRCCTWTYCTPEGGAADPERCCLKSAVPAEVAAATHWTGAPPRASSPSCVNPPPPPYPGPTWAWPRVTNSPACTRLPNWHDIAGAAVVDGVYHVFMGCNAFGGVAAGWHHASSTNLVDWQNHGIEPGLSAMAEPYGTSSPCSGFVVVDDDGTVCAGFRECGGNWPGRSNTQVPLELRCALNRNLTSWGPPEYLFWFYFNRNLPYDPVRPWKDGDNKWYATISADGCNSTVPCARGGALFLYSSPALRGAAADWQLVNTTAVPGGLMFASNYTVLQPFNPAAAEVHELVTAGYFGALAGDPRGGATRCLTNNVFDAGFDGTTAYFCGTQAAGGPLLVDFSDAAATGMLDWGCTRDGGAAGAAGVAALVAGAGGPWKMARTLSPQSPNQVNGAGRKIITAWVDAGAGVGQALPRDLSLDAVSGELLQAFAPELRALRTGSGAPAGLRSQQVEVYAVFAVAAGADAQAEFGVRALLSEDGLDAQTLAVNLGRGLVGAAAHAGPLLPPPTPGAAFTVTMHAIIDHSIVTVIVNNRTAITAIVAPRDADSSRLELYGVDGVTIAATTFQAWALRNATFTGS